MTEYKQEEIKPFQKLSNDKRDDLAAKISKWWEDFNNKRLPQIDTALQLQEHLFLRQKPRNKTAKWKANLKENKIYTVADTMKSIMFKEVWSNESQMFDINPMDKGAEGKYKLQKEAIVKALKDMKSGKQYDLVIDYWLQYGDFIFLTDWKHLEKTVKRKGTTTAYIDRPIPTYDNANITAINPMFFAFDVTNYKYGDDDSWNSCIKIYKRFESLESIKSNKVYTLTTEQELDLTTENTKIDVKKEDNQLRQDKKYGDSHEVLYMHGDLKYNGVTYKNVIAEVLAGKYLIRFEENPIFINPFVFDVTELDPLTGRGISPLKCILNMAEAKEELLNLSIDLAQLNANPPAIMDKNSIEDKDTNTELEPGKKVGLTPGYEGKLPIPMKFDSQGIFDAVSYISNAMSDTSSINANVMGNVESGKKLATDLHLAQQGTNSRTALKLDKIYQINLKVIKNVAELLAMFKDGSEQILINDMGNRTVMTIDNAVREANYDYVYEDRNSLIDRRAKYQEVFALFSKIGEDPELKQLIDWREVITTGVEMTGFDNPDKFFKTENPVVSQMQNLLKKLPEDMQVQISQMVLASLQQMGGNNAQQINSPNQVPVQA